MSTRPARKPVATALLDVRPTLRVFVGRSMVSGRDLLTLREARLWVAGAGELHALNGAREDRTYLVVSEQQGLVEQITVPGAATRGETLASAL